MVWTKLKDGTYLNQANIICIQGDENGCTIHTLGSLPRDLAGSGIKTDEPIKSLIKRVINDADGVSAMMRRKYGQG